jgi:hypothetical protein
VRLRTDATNRKLAPFVGSSTTCWTAYFQGFGFNNTASHHANIIDVEGHQVWSKLHNLETNCSAIARLRDPTGHKPRRVARNIDGRIMLDTTLLASIAQQMTSGNPFDAD